MFWPDHRLKWSTSPLFSSPCFSALCAVFQLREVYQALCCNKLSTVLPSPLAQTKQKLGNRGRKWDGPSAGFVWDQNRAMAWLAGEPRLKKRKKKASSFFLFESFIDWTACDGCRRAQVWRGSRWKHKNGAKSASRVCTRSSMNHSNTKGKLGRLWRIE